MPAVGLPVQASEQVQGPAQDRLGQGDDQARLFGNRDELVGRNRTEVGVIPAGQRLERRDGARPDVDDRLIDRRDPIGLDGLPQVDLEPETTVHPAVVDGGEPDGRGGQRRKVGGGARGQGLGRRHGAVGVIDRRPARFTRRRDGAAPPPARPGLSAGSVRATVREFMIRPSLACCCLPCCPMDDADTGSHGS